MRSTSTPVPRCPSRPSRCGFAAGDGWARATVAASRTLDGPWTPVAYGELFYRLSFEGREFASTPAAVGRQEARYWRVVPAAPLRGQGVELELTFPQEYLRVAVSGGAPYLLAAGTLLEEAGPDATLSSVWSALEPPADVVPFATLGARRELGGSAALVAARPFPWRTAALWSVLIAGVLVVGTMAVRLARDMRSQPVLRSAEQADATRSDSFLYRLVGNLALACLLWLALSLGAVFLFRWVDPPTTAVMLLQPGRVERHRLQVGRSRRDRLERRARRHGVRGSTIHRASRHRLRVARQGAGGLSRRRQLARRVHDHAAGREEFVLVARPQLRPQGARGVLRRAARDVLVEGANPRGLPEHRGVRARVVRRRSGRARVLPFERRGARRLGRGVARGRVAESARATRVAARATTFASVRAGSSRQMRLLESRGHFRGLDW